jgi:hypothetical protein
MWVALGVLLGLMVLTSVLEFQVGPFSRLVATQGVSMTDLTPAGGLPVRGERWSATSLNGSATAGRPVEVREVGVQLGVRCENSEIHDTQDGPDRHTTPLTHLEAGTARTESYREARS